jgi:four helix bundle protein
VKLRTYDLSIDAVRGISRLVGRVEMKDPDLARQLRRALASVPLNLAESEYSQGRLRASRLHSAMASANEVIACLDVAAAAGYIPPQAIAADRDRLDHIVASVYKLIRAASAKATARRS